MCVTVSVVLMFEAGAYSILVNNKMVMASLVTVFGLRSLLSYVVTDLVGQRVGETDPTTGAFWHKAAAVREPRAECIGRTDPTTDTALAVFPSVE